MLIQNAYYHDFRNLTEETVEFSPSVNVLWGMNAQGKSNILEGVWYFARGRSFRGAHDRDMIREGSGGAAFGVSVDRDGREHPVTLSAELRRDGKKRLFKNGAPLSSVSEMIGCFRAVLFCPAHLTVVTGGPAERRALLNVAISQLDRAYIRDLQIYKIALSNRSALLKRIAAGDRVTDVEIEIWADHLASAGSRIAAARAKYVAALSDHVAAFFEEMTAGREIPRTEYRSHLLSGGEYTAEEGEKLLFRKLTENVDREAAAGATLWGVHKDDIALSLDGREARLFASQGQQRSFALALKLAEGEISREATGEYPVFLLDDVFSELDRDRRRYIMDKLGGRQIIVTSCEPTVIPEGEDSVRFIEIKDGKIVR